MKPFLRAGMTVGVGLVLLWGSVLANRSHAEDNKAHSDDHVRAVLRAILRDADRFRLEAASNAKDAVARHGIEGFPEKWAENVEPHFRGEEWRLTHFLAYSVILVGRADPPKCVVAFYNPWVDGLLLTAWRDRPADGWKATDFTFCLGEALRGEKTDDPTCPAWMKSGKPIARSVIEVCRGTVSAFQKHFPWAGPFEYPVIKAPIVFHTELSTLKARMKFSLAYLSERAMTPERREGLDQRLREAMPVLARGDKGAILALTSKDQDPYVAETICLLPPNIREGFAPHWAVGVPLTAWRPGATAPVASNQCHMTAVVLSNAEMPRWFILLFVDLSQVQPGARKYGAASAAAPASTAPPIRALGLYDFETVSAPLRQ